MNSGELVCSNAEFFEYLLSFTRNGDIPSRRKKRIIEEFKKRFGAPESDLPDFPDETSKWVWLAGIIDAECSLSLQKSKKKTKRGFQYISRLNCSSTTPSLLFQIKRVCYPFGCVSSHHFQDKRSSFWKSTRKFSMMGNGLRLALPKVLPFLVVKTGQAERLLEALSLLAIGKKDEVVENRLGQLWQEMRRLNKRGK